MDQKYVSRVAVRQFNLLTDLYTHNGHLPNFTIITPGACNAKCSFCFWNHEDGKIKPPASYLSNLSEVIQLVPQRLAPALSITGGEPLLSPHLEGILNMLQVSPRKWDRVVLTTNGTHLAQWLGNEVFRKVITHINISRHHFKDEDNQAIYKTDSVPSATIIRELVLQHRDKVQFNINCVLAANATSDFVRSMMGHVVFDLCAPSVSFRTVAGDVAPTPLEKEFTQRYGIQSTNDCPVCRTATQTIGGLKVLWKGSHPQPSQFLGSLYELVFHPDGKVYADWDRKITVELKMLPQTPEGRYWYEQWRKLQVRRENVAIDEQLRKQAASPGGGCGGGRPSGGNCGGGYGGFGPAPLGGCGGSDGPGSGCGGGSSGCGGS